MNICDVCKLLDNDETLKECEWCELCKAWICKRDIKNNYRRSLAMLKRKLNVRRIIPVEK